MDWLHLSSIVLESVIVFIAVGAAIKGRKYMYGLALTFAVYVFYDLAKYYSFGGIYDAILPIIFFVGTVSAFLSVWFIAKNGT